jgi:hypothetical protein
MGTIFGSYPPSIGPARDGPYLANHEPFRTHAMAEVTVPCALFRCVQVTIDGIR